MMVLAWCCCLPAAQAFESSLHTLTFDPMKAKAEDLMVRAATQDEKMK